MRDWAIATCVVLLSACFEEEAPTPGGGADADTAATTGTTGDPSATTSASTVTSVGSATSDESSDTSTMMECAAGGTCIDAPPEGWMGPFAFAFFDPNLGPPTCAAPYAEPLATPLHAGLVEGVLDCGCECSEPETECIADLSKYESPTSICDIASSFGPNQVPGQCTITGSTLVNAVQYVVDDEPPPPTCTGSIGKTQRADPAWEQHVALCGLVAPQPGCDAGVCVPALPESFSAICILAPGIPECPGDYAAEHVVFGGAEDERECDACTCDAVAADCTPIVYRSTDTGCADLDMGDDGCVPVSDDILATVWQPTTPAACEPVQSITGEVVPTGRHTLCCRS